MEPENIKKHVLADLLSLYKLAFKVKLLKYFFAFFLPISFGLNIRNKTLKQ